jgi:meso-butanediol dehydrogenase / (S,S)-butanediol dehydrogenase / diacetyl reductase
MDLKGRVGIVTGAARGIGHGISLELAREGMNIVAVDLLRDPLNELVQQIKELNVRALALDLDVSSAEATGRMARETIREFGQIDVLVNNAAIVVVAPFVELTEEDWDKVIKVNLKGSFLCCKAVVPYMIQRKSGRIVNISSVAGKKAPPFISAYSASKHGLIGLTQALAQELGVHNITANAVCPGFVPTPLWENLMPTLSKAMGVDPSQFFETFAKTSVPLQRLQTAEDIGQCVAFLCKADNISGIAINVDGGYTMI